MKSMPHFHQKIKVKIKCVLQFCLVLYGLSICRFLRINKWCVRIAKTLTRFRLVPSLKHFPSLEGYRFKDK